MTALSMLRRYWQLAVILTLVGVLMLACHERDSALIAKGRAEEQLKALTAKTRRDSIAASVASAVVTRDTVILTKWLTKYDTIRHTLNIHDTVAVVTYLNTVDSTIHACREAVGSLTTLCQRKDTLIADLKAQLAVRAAQPAKSTRQFSLGIGAGYGATVSGGTIHAGPSVTIGGTWHPF